VPYHRPMVYQAISTNEMFLVFPFVFILLLVPIVVGTMIEDCGTYMNAYCPGQRLVSIYVKAMLLFCKGSLAGMR
jgi:hypothetical protein